MPEPVAARYAKSGNANIAYLVAGQPGPDLVLVLGWASNVEHLWSDPIASPFLRRLASFSRLIMLDRRGTGLSDRVAALPSIEQRMDEVRAVMDAAGSERAMLFGVSEGGPMCISFAATYPERTAGLLLYGTFAKLLAAEGNPDGIPAADFKHFVARTEAEWGRGASLKALGPSVAHDAHAVAAWGRLERLSVSPAGIRTLLEGAADIDVRHLLGTVKAPTLVLHRRGDHAVPINLGRAIAERIPGARFVALDGADHLAITGDVDALLGEVAEFATGTRHGPEPDRVLATVLFVDMVDSTPLAAELGDRRWRELLDRWYGLVREELGRYGGREIDSAGDSLLAAFDSPARAVRCAWSTVGAVRQLGVEVRAGIHTGECEVLGPKLSGIAVHIGARVAGRAGGGEVLVSGTVKDLVAGSGIAFEPRGPHALKGVPDEWPLFAVIAV